MSAISVRPIAVVIEYDRRGKRVEKYFPCSYAARRFYIQKYWACCNPKVKKPK